MIKRLGLIFGIFFILMASINYLNSPFICRVNVVGFLLGGICFIVTMNSKALAKITQPILLLLYGCTAVVIGDVNSIVPIICYIFVMGMTAKYFPKMTLLKCYLPLPYLFTAVLSDWALLEILASVLLYIALTTILYIIQNDHV